MKDLLPFLQIRKDTSTIEHEQILQSTASGCLSRNGHLCIGLCIIVILLYLPSSCYHHLLSLALISIFNLLIVMLDKRLLNRVPGCRTNSRTEDNNSDNNFYFS